MPNVMYIRLVWRRFPLLCATTVCTAVDDGDDDDGNSYTTLYAVRAQRNDNTKEKLEVCISDGYTSAQAHV